ncbi:hypothetical protein [Acinetobacter tandoii]|uniref:Uncharacterized protein n=1 Tax=Acinetobacter tandoii DSM 14970 = CIP 107469 TaxID=1120927 RepID=R9B1S0_9GAMM|nr:hypothetical protein [Acinetobacter tandoii]EOR08230.1 hypothetical protein I593_01585 [Acinetobacter tandoii DSM 14970 = CIP 107469]
MHATQIVQVKVKLSKPKIVLAYALGAVGAVAQALSKKLIKSSVSMQVVPVHDKQSTAES